MKAPVATVPPVVLHTFQGGWGLRSLSPFCLKADAVLTLAGVPMVAQAPTGPPKTRSGKLPALDPGDGTLVEGSDAIVDWLRDVRGVDLDLGLTAEQRAVSLALRRTVEEHLYFVMAGDRWVAPVGYAAAMPAYFGHLPPVVRTLAPMMLRGGVRRAISGQGLGRMSPERRTCRVREDLDALAATLGDRDWFFGDRPTTLDATVYAFVANILAQPMETMLRTEARQRTALVDHASRMGDLLYASPATP